MLNLDDCCSAVQLTQGGNFSAITGTEPETLKFDEDSFNNLATLFEEFGAEAGLARLPTTEIWDFPPPQIKIDSLKSYINDVSAMTADDYKYREKSNVVQSLGC